MPASIVVTNLAWSTPDGRSVISQLDLGFSAERVGLVGRNGVGKTTLLKLIAGELSPLSGSVSVNGRLGVLRQDVRPTPGETIADLFGVADALVVLRRAERGEADADDLSMADWTLETRIAAALGGMGLKAAPETLLSSLSGGQRTRAALAALVFAQPDFVLLDEPTNNLDVVGRTAVIDFLAGWRAGAIVVSHDRELLETMEAMVELTSLGATRYGGPWSRYRELKALELAAAEREVVDADRRVSDVAQAGQAMAERKARKDGAGARKASRGDQPRILLGAMKGRSEATSGEQARLVERRREQAAEAAASARARLEVIQPLTVTLPPTGLPAHREVLRLDRVSAGYEPGHPVVEDLSFDITGPERVAITGPNGSGKTTLLKLVIGELQPWRGSARVFTPFALLDQTVSILEPEASIRDNFRRLNPGADENACRAALARFRFRADAALQMVATLSGGQLLRAGLACALGGGAPPPLLILDEPTNHLDFDSIEAVEAGLRAYDGALLIVSHDGAFLEAVGLTRRLELAG